MNVNSSLVTDTGRDVTVASVDGYRDQISKHMDNDYAAHTSMQLHLVPFFEQAPANTHLVANAVLRMELVDNSNTTQVYALPALIQPGTFPPTGSAPIILTQPASQSAILGSTVVLTVYAASSSRVFYQWQKNNVNIANATDSSLTLLSVQLTDAGNYRCILTNATPGQVISSVATLTVTTV